MRSRFFIRTPPLRAPSRSSRRPPARSSRRPSPARRRASRSRRCASEKNLAIATPSATLSFGGTSRPFSPSRTTSGTPPTAVAITGHPTASASTTVCGKFSQADGRTEASAARKSRSTVSRGTLPGSGLAHRGRASWTAARAHAARARRRREQVHAVRPDERVEEHADGLLRASRPAKTRASPSRSSSRRSSSRGGIGGTVGAGFGSTETRPGSRPQCRATSRGRRSGRRRASPASRRPCASPVESGCAHLPVSWNASSVPA